MASDLPGNKDTDLHETTDEMYRISEQSARNAKRNHAIRWARRVLFGALVVALPVLATLEAAHLLLYAVAAGYLALFLGELQAAPRPPGVQLHVLRVGARQSESKQLATPIRWASTIVVPGSPGVSAWLTPHGALHVRNETNGEIRAVVQLVDIGG